MDKLHGFRIAIAEIVQVFRHWPQLVVIGLLWSAIATAAVIGMCIYLAWYEGHAIDIAAYLNRMYDGDLTRQYLVASSAGTLFGQLATAIAWTRLVLLDEQPQAWLRLPLGSARYFARSIILLFLCVLGAVPGILAGGVAGTVIPGTPGRFAGGAVMGIGVLASMYLCMRMWLIFPAIAIEDEAMTMSRSLKITAAAPLAIVIAPLLAYLPFLLIGSAIEILPALVSGGTLGTAVAIAAEFCSTFAILAAVAASSGAMAILYDRLVPNSPTRAEVGA